MSKSPLETKTLCSGSHVKLAHMMLSKDARDHLVHISRLGFRDSMCGPGLDPASSASSAVEAQLMQFRENVSS
jgi:hypothetical protein